MGAALAGIGIAGMIGNVASSGVNSATQSDGIRQNIGDVEASTKKWKERYAKINGDKEQMVAQLGQGVQDLQEEYGSIVTKLKVQREAHAESLKSTQMIGIIFVSIIFFALLLKQFNLLGPLIHVLGMPEKFIWNYVVHGKTSGKSNVKK